MQRTQTSANVCTANIVRIQGAKTNTNPPEVPRSRPKGVAREEGANFWEPVAEDVDWEVEFVEFPGWGFTGAFLTGEPLGLSIGVSGRGLMIILALGSALGRDTGGGVRESYAMSSSLLSYKLYMQTYTCIYIHIHTMGYAHTHTTELSDPNVRRSRNPKDVADPVLAIWTHAWNILGEKVPSMFWTIYRNFPVVQFCEISPLI